jgi:hypothetical protein
MRLLASSMNLLAVTWLLFCTCLNAQNVAFLSEYMHFLKLLSAWVVGYTNDTIRRRIDNDHVREWLSHICPMFFWNILPNFATNENKSDYPKLDEQTIENIFSWITMTRKRIWKVFSYRIISVLCSSFNRQLLSSSCSTVTLLWSTNINDRARSYLSSRWQWNDTRYFHSTFISAFFKSISSCSVSFHETDILDISFNTTRFYCEQYVNIQKWGYYLCTMLSSIKLTHLNT